MWLVIGSSPLLGRGGGSQVREGLIPTGPGEAKKAAAPLHESSRPTRSLRTILPVRVQAQRLAVACSPREGSQRNSMEAFPMYCWHILEHASLSTPGQVYRTEQDPNASYHAYLRRPGHRYPSPAFQRVPPGPPTLNVTDTCPGGNLLIYGFIRLLWGQCQAVTRRSYYPRGVDTARYSPDPSRSISAGWAMNRYPHGPYCFWLHPILIK